jgi:FkbM family methyltransferase
MKLPAVARLLFVQKLLQDEPMTVVDVGASGGMSSPWKTFHAPLRYIGFEPDETEHAKLVARADSSRESYRNVGLAGQKGRALFYVTKQQASSSLLEPNIEWVSPFRTDFAVSTTVEVEVDTLDHQVSPPVDFIKLDTQGTELQILNGAENALRTTFALNVEVEFQPLYKNQPLFGDVDAFLRQRGFECFDLFPRYWKRIQGKRYG